jgi:hypothetical protein
MQPDPIENRLADVESRLAELHSRVSRLSARIDASGSETEPWWKRLVGIYADDPAFDEAEQFGREWRQSI